MKRYRILIINNNDNDNGHRSVMRARSRLILVYAEEDDQLTLRSTVKQRYSIQVSRIG